MALDITNKISPQIKGASNDVIVFKEEEVTSSGKLVSSSNIRKINFIIRLVNYFFTVILSLTALRICFQMIGSGDNFFYKISYIFVHPVFSFMGTVPVYGVQHLERESLIAMLCYAFMVPLLTSVLNSVKDAMKLRYKENKRLIRDLAKLKSESKGDQQ